jgi:hypothetical protein
MTARVQEAHIEAYGLYDPVKLDQINKDYPLERALVSAVQRRDTLQVLRLIEQGVDPMKQIFISEVPLDYSDFSISQSTRPFQCYTHSPMMVALFIQDYTILDILIESHHLSAMQSTSLCIYAIEQHKTLALAFLLVRKGFPPHSDLVQRAEGQMPWQDRRSKKISDDVFILDKEKNQPGWCARYFDVITRAVTCAQNVENLVSEVDEKGL